MFRHFFTFVLLIFTFSKLFAQKKSTRDSLIQGFFTNISFDKSFVDTLFNGFKNYHPSLFTSPTGGFMNGTNGYKDQAKAQMYFADSSYYVLGAIYWFGYKRSTPPSGNSNLIFRLYRRDGIQNILGIPSPVPGTWYEEKIFPLDSIPAGEIFETSAFIWLLDTPRIVQGAYYFSFDMSLMHHLDTIALFSSDSGEVLLSNMSWELWEGHWNTIQNNWGLPVDFAIFPIVDVSNISLPIYSEQFAHIILLNNPSRDIFNINIFTKAPRKFNFHLLSSNGRFVRTWQKYLADSENFISIDSENLEKGIYFLIIQSSSMKPVAFRLVKN